jgi:hypothetical protein
MSEIPYRPFPSPDNGIPKGGNSSGVAEATQSPVEVRKESATQAMWRRRPPEITARIDESFASTVKSEYGVLTGENKYLYTDTGVEYYGVAGVRSDELVKIFLSEADTPVPVLDAGAGNGMFSSELNKAYGERLSLHDISATDFRSEQDRTQWTASEYRTGNVEHLQDYYPPNSFGLEFSRLTITHTVDPLGTLSLLYDALQNGGIMAIDGFKIHGIDRPSAVIHALQAKGYEVAATYTYKLQGNELVEDKIGSLVIRKTADHPALDFPVDYNGLTSENPDDRRAKYAANPEAIATSPSTSPTPPEIQRYFSLMREIYPFLKEIPDDKYNDQLFVRCFGKESIFANTDAFPGTLSVLNAEWQNRLSLAESSDEFTDRLSLMREVTPLIPRVLELYAEQYIKKPKDDFKKELRERAHLPIT